MKKTLFSLLMLLLTAVSGAWAQTTHVVNQDNVDQIFSGDGYTLGDGVAAGDILDFQGTINLEDDASHSLVINKPVNIISSTKDAVVRLHTPAGDRTGKNPGNTFVINADGAGTKVQDIRLENTGMWIFNTSNVTFTGVTFHVEDASLCNGVGHVSIRYSDHITFDGCTVYTKDNAGSSAVVLTGSSNCTFQNSHIENAGNVGNPLYIGNPYNTADKPSDYTMVHDDCKVINCTITADKPSALMQFRIQGGLRYLVEGCTVVNVTPGFATTATSAADGYTIRNNTFTTGLSIPKASTFTGNSVTGNVTVSANGSDYIGSTITGNSILGKVTFSSNSKNNTFTGNTVISSEAYAVVMATTKDANNTVQNNVLMAKGNAGDAAIDPKTGSGNTLTPNQSEAKAGDATWSFDAATGTLTIGGTGAMADFEQTTGGQSTAPWAFLSDKITRIVIGEGVTKVGNNAFADCKAVNDVFVKGTNTLTIGTNAFDTSATPAIYVPVGTETAYQQAWSAYASSISGYMNCGGDAMAIYDATTHTLTICGSGAMTDFASAADQPWKALQGDVQNVIIEPTITKIGANAFSGCTALTTVNILGTTTTITDGAFDGNATGRRIILPVSVIGNYGESTYLADIYATGQCGAEGSDITWELNAKTMALAISGTGAMADYASSSNVPWYSAHSLITSATIGSGITAIGKSAFYGCSIMATVSIPATVTSIGSYAFTGCSALTAIDIPAAVTTIGDHAFQKCSMTTFVIPAGVTEITQGCFRQCASLTAIDIPSTVTTIADYAFDECSLLNNVTIPDGVTTIGQNAFSGCEGLTAIVIPAAVTTIGADAFDGCTGLTSVSIPEGVTNIGNYAFYDCSKLETIYIPATVTSVGNQAFRGCSKLAEVYIFATSLTKYGSDAFRDTPAELKIYVPAAAVDTYKAGWSKYANNIEAITYDYNLTVDAENNLHGTIAFFVNGYKVDGANEGKLVTMTVTPEEGYVVGTVSATAYTTWAGASRRTTIPLLGDVTLTAVEGAENTWTFKMPAASVMASADYLKISTLTFSPADKTNLMEVKVNNETAKPDEEGKITKIPEGSSVTLNTNTGYKFRKVEVKKSGESTLEPGMNKASLTVPASWENDEGYLTTAELPGFKAITAEEAAKWVPTADDQTNGAYLIYGFDAEGKALTYYTAPGIALEKGEGKLLHSDMYVMSNGPALYFRYYYTSDVAYSFAMPNADATATYEVVRDMTYKVSSQTAERVRIQKKDGKYNAVDPFDLVPAVSDNIGSQAKPMVMGEATDTDKDFYIKGLQKLDGENWVDVTELSVATYRLVIAGIGNYDGIIYSAPIALYEGYEVTVPAGEFITYYKDEALKLEDADKQSIELYTVSSISNDKAVLSQACDAMPKNTPMLVYNKGSEDKTFLLIPCNDPDLALTVAPEFKGTLTATTIAASTANQTNYAFNGKQFVWVKDAINIGANKAWLSIENANARAINIVFDETTGLSEELRVKSEEFAPAQWYTVDGRKLQGKPTKKGMYILNGKKVVVK